MGQRISPGGAHIRICLKIIGSPKVRTRVPAFYDTMEKVVKQRVDSRSANVLIVIEIPTRVEQRVRGIATGITFPDVMFGGAEAVARLRILLSVMLDIK